MNPVMEEDRQEKEERRKTHVGILKMLKDVINLIQWMHFAVGMNLLHVLK